MDLARMQDMYLVRSAFYHGGEEANIQLVRREVGRVCYYSRPLRTHERAVGSSYTSQEVCIPF